MKLDAQGQYVQTDKYGLFASLLCNWSNEFENNKDEQKFALSIFEKAIEMDQNLGWHVINSWTRNYAKLESGLKNIVIQYWYLANVNNKILKHTLDCADLIETYFNDNQEKMKRAEILSGCAPIELRDLPFVRIIDAPNNSNKNDNQNNNNKNRQSQKKEKIVVLTIELDDCCNQCRWPYCQLLHSVQPVS